MARMAGFRIGQAADILGVSVDTVRRWADSGRLATTRTPGGRRMVDGADLARFVRTLAEKHPSPTLPPESARNHFTGIVTKVTKDGVMAQVEMQAGPYRVVSLMSREAAEELQLEPGSVAVAAVKATNVVIELLDMPAGSR